jgi:DNA-binding winged helix-turn-helix (wHTH) protein
VFAVQSFAALDVDHGLRIRLNLFANHTGDVELSRNFRRIVWSRRGAQQGTRNAVRGHFLFPPFRLDAVNEQLWRGSKLVALRPKTFEVLHYLVQNAQRLVTKQELLDQVWADTVVSDELLRRYIRELREALGDDAKKPQYIATVSARGYRFLLRVELEAPSSPANARAQGLPLEKKPAKTQKEVRVGFSIR